MSLCDGKEATMTSQGIRDLLVTLEADGELHRVKRTVDPRF